MEDQPSVGDASWSGDPALTEKIKAFIERAVVVLSAAVTWLVLAAAVITAFAGEIAPLLPTPWSERLSAWTLSAVAIIGAAIAIIRRVTPVAAEERGILPQ